ncbi:MAG TPA: hypothetical protein VGG09_15510 [Acidimicrobiales bacterium]|jgi:hypothetical protein
MSQTKSQVPAEEARRRLIEAEIEYQNARAGDYVALRIRDAAMVEAHRAGLSSREISELVGDIGQPNVVRARRRAFTRSEVIPDGLLSPVDALRDSGMTARDFITAVRTGEIETVDLPGGVRAFRVEDIKRKRPVS